MVLVFFFGGVFRAAFSGLVLRILDLRFCRGLGGLGFRV